MAYRRFFAYFSRIGRQRLPGGEMDELVHRILRFDRFELDLTRGCLRSGGRDLDLRPKAFKVLHHLVVNAGRLIAKEELQTAVWAGIAVSDDSLVQCIRQLRRALDDEAQRLIKTVSRRGYLLDVQVFDHDLTETAGTGALAAREAEPLSAAPRAVLTRPQEAMANEDSAGELMTQAVRRYDGTVSLVTTDGILALPDKPSIAVLPFQNMSDDAGQEYFVDGITEDIITALSRIPLLFVIARNSSFAYRDKAIDIRQIGRELGVRYVLEGSVRRAGNRVRITGQLVEAKTGSHLWADRFDSVLEDVFDLQDRVAMAVAGVVEPSITQAEIRRVNHKPTENLQAYDWLLRAFGEQQLFSRDSSDRAVDMGRRAIELDPRYARAYACLAAWITARWTNGWMKDEAAETADGLRFAHLAVQLAPSDSIVLAEAATGVSVLNHDLATAISWLDRAITLNPNSALAHSRGAIVRNYAGDYATAIDHANRAMRLSPFDSHAYIFSAARGVGHFYRRQLPEAVSWLREATRQNPHHSATYLFLGSGLAHAGQLDEALAAIRRLLELRPMNGVRWWRQHRRYPEDDFEYMLEGARRAGLPE